jgi:hypothetical protein
MRRSIDRCAQPAAGPQFVTAPRLQWEGARPPAGAQHAHAGRALQHLRAQAVVAHTAEVKVVERAVAATNGNGNGNGASNGNGNGNGVYALNGNGNGNGSNSAVKVIVANGNGNGAAAAYSSNGNGASSGNGNGNGNGVSAQTAATVVVAAAAASERARVLNTIDEEQNAVASGKLELAAVTGGRTAAGTPYSNPGGRWSKFKSYGVWQRTFEIWGFAFSFAFKYALLKAPFTYKGGRKGMTPEAMSKRKQELAEWLREGLVKLGVRGGARGAGGSGLVGHPRLPEVRAPLSCAAPPQGSSGSDHRRHLTPPQNTRPRPQPTFIKIGQQFSTRVDVLAPEFVKELEKLQVGGLGGLWGPVRGLQAAS